MSRRMALHPVGVAGTHSNRSFLLRWADHPPHLRHNVTPLYVRRWGRCDSWVQKNSKMGAAGSINPASFP
eukprot:8742007-Pyramimonas_sp.AAC.1